MPRRKRKIDWPNMIGALIIPYVMILGFLALLVFCDTFNPTDWFK